MACPPPPENDDFNTSPTPRCFSTSHRFSNYDKTPYVVFFYPQSNKTNIFSGLFIFPQVRTHFPTSPSTHQQEPFKVYVLQQFELQPGKSTKIFNQDIKVRITTIDIKQQDRLCMKPSIPETQYADDVFQMQTFICAIDFSINKSRSGSTRGKLNMKRALKVLNNY